MCAPWSSGKVGAELLFDVISTAYERTSPIVTTNLPFESWTEVLGSERLTGATLDRLTHRCHIIETRARATASMTPRPGTAGRSRTMRRIRSRRRAPGAKAVDNSQAGK